MRIVSRAGLAALACLLVGVAAMAEDAPAPATSTAGTPSARSAATIGAATAPAPAAAPSPAPANSSAAAQSSQAATAALTLEPGKPIDLACASKSVVVATDAANATSGGMTLRLELTAGASDGVGTWRPVAVDAGHAGSLAALQGKVCAQGCPLVQQPGGDIQLWAPAPKPVTALGADELLMLAVLKVATLDFKASTFRGQQVEALESGSCQVQAATDTPTSGSPK